MLLLRGTKFLVFSAVLLASTACAYIDIPPLNPGSTALSGDHVYIRGLDAEQHSEQRIQFKSETPVPRGYFDLCQTDHPVCAVSDEARAIVLTSVSIRQIHTVNRQVNGTIRPQPEPKGKDIWRVAGTAGDCEDYALKKKGLLIEAGWPPESLLIAIVRIRGGEEHAVLVARTSGGDFVLDNRRQEIRPWNKTGYRWQMIQSPTQKWVWHSVM